MEALQFLTHASLSALFAPHPASVASGLGPAWEDAALPGGGRMPRVGFGTAGLGEGTAAAVRSALSAGYRLLDSAQAREWYREDLVGEALAASGVPRSEVPSPPAPSRAPSRRASPCTRPDRRRPAEPPSLNPRPSA